MLSFKIFVVGFALIAAVYAQNATEPKDCTRKVRCSNVENVVWATDGETCSVFRNSCQFGNANCQRQNNGENKLKSVTQSECQEHCSEFCPRMLDPVCGDYNGGRRTFSNLCVMNSHICETGETYTVFNHNECEAEDDTKSNESGHLLNLKLL